MVLAQLPYPGIIGNVQSFCFQPLVREISYCGWTLSAKFYLYRDVPFKCERMNLTKCGRRNLMNYNILDVVDRDRITLFSVMAW